MSITMDDNDELITRLKKRVWEEPADPNAWGYPGPPHPPLPLESVEQAEQLLGFRLPSLVRRLYLEVADGFWGPGLGLPPLLDKINADNGSLVDAMMHIPQSEMGRPANSVSLCCFGCGYEALVKLDEPDLPVIYEEIADDAAPFGYSHSFPGFSLHDFLLTWLDGGDEALPPFPETLILAERERVLDQALDARTLPEIAIATRELQEWVRQHPKDVGIREAFEGLSLMQDIAEEQKAERAHLNLLTGSGGGSC